MKQARLIFIVGLALFTGCTDQAAIDQLKPKDQIEFARQFIASLAARDLPTAEKQIEPSLLVPGFHDKLQQLADLFPTSPPTEVQELQWNGITMSDREQLSVTLQYVYPRSWVAANVVLLKQGGQIRVIGIHVAPLADSLQNINRFSFAGKGVANYLFLVLGVAIPLFVLVALVACVRTRVPRLKWLWLIFIALGVCRFSLDWTNGRMDVQPLSFLLLGAAFTKAGEAAPALLSFAVPLGAILFFIRRRHWQAPKSEQSPPPADASRLTDEEGS